jgi:hypothetical protein
VDGAEDAYARDMALDADCDSEGAVCGIVCANENKNWDAVPAHTKCFLNASSEREDGTRLMTIAGQESEAGDAAGQVSRF